MKKLINELEELNVKSERLYEAVEEGYLPLDSSLQDRSHKLQARKQELLIQVSGYRRQRQLPDIKQNQLAAFTKALRSRLMDRDYWPRENKNSGFMWLLLARRLIMPGFMTAGQD